MAILEASAPPPSLEGRAAMSIPNRSHHWTRRAVPAAVTLVLTLQGCASGPDRVIRPRLSLHDVSPVERERAEVAPGTGLASPAGPAESTWKYLVLSGAAEGLVGALVGSDDLRDPYIWNGSRARPDEVSFGDLTSGALYGAMRGLLRGNDLGDRPARWRLHTSALGFPNAGTVRIR